MNIEYRKITVDRAGHVREQSLLLPRAHSFSLPDDCRELDSGLWQRVTDYPLSQVTEIWRVQ